MRLPFASACLLLLLLSCAPKVEVERERACADPERILTEYAHRRVPENFRIYGALRYGPLKLPMLLAKFDSFYTVKVAKAKDVSIEKDRLCLEGKCYLLPFAPENLIFGKVLSGTEYSFCSNGLTTFRERTGVYEKLVLFERTSLREVVIRNVRKNRSFRVIFRSPDPGGFFRELDFEMDGKRVKLLVEEVEI